MQYNTLVKYIPQYYKLYHKIRGMAVVELIWSRVMIINEQYAFGLALDSLWFGYILAYLKSWYRVVHIAC